MEKKKGGEEIHADEQTDGWIHWRQYKMSSRTEKKAHDKQAHEYPWSLKSCKTGLKLQNEDMYILHSRSTVFNNIFLSPKSTLENKKLEEVLYYQRFD